MVRIVIVTHGRLASELAATARLIFGTLEGVHEVNLPPDRDIDDMKAELAGIMESAAGGSVVLLTDMFGGSAFMAAAPYARAPDRMLVAGVNLPLFLDLLQARETEDIEGLKKTVEANKERYLVLFKEPAK